MNNLSDTLEFERFFAAYVRAALWSSPAYAGEGDARQDDSLETCGFTIDSLAPSTHQAMLADCAKFWQGNRDGIGEKITCAGHDFWLTRCRHGSGFWDSPEMWGVENAELLTAAAHEFPEVDLYIGDGGLIYQSPA